MASEGEKNKLQGRVGASFVRLILENNGYQVQTRHEDYGVDLQVNKTFRRDEPGDKHRYVSDGWQVDIQVKTVLESQLAKTGTDLLFDLEAKNFRDLEFRKNSAIPLILVVVVLPSNRDMWVEIKEDSILMKKCMYWYTPSGKNSSINNTATVRIKLGNDVRIDNFGFEKILAKYQ